MNRKEQHPTRDGCCSSLLFGGSLQQQGYGLCILALVEAGFKDRLILEIAEAEQLEGAELTVVA